MERGEGPSKEASEALSLLVDGVDVVEAMLVVGEKVYCYPCKAEEWVEEAMAMVEELVREGVLSPSKDYVAVRRGEVKLVAVPLEQGRILAVVARGYVDGESLARYLAELPYKLQSRIVPPVPSPRARESNNQNTTGG